MSTATLDRPANGKPAPAAQKDPAPKPIPPKPTPKPAAKATPKPKPDPNVTTRKGVDGQVCTGACGKWKPLTDYGKTSKARGNKPMRRCRACIIAEQAARKATVKAAAAATPEKPAKAAPKTTAKKGAGK